MTGTDHTNDASSGSSRAVRPASRWLTLTLVAAATLLADQASKIWALDALADERRRPLLGDLFGLQLIHNSGAAFSLAAGQTWVLTLVAVGIGVFVVSQVRRIANLWWAICLGLILGGLLGNLGDRLFRPPSFGQGHVVDFLNYNGWFIGNVADIAIVGSAIGMVLLSLLGIGYDDREGSREPMVEGTADSDDNGGHA